MGDIKGKIKDAGRKFAFGLRRSELSSMQESVRSLSATAELALLVIDL